METKLRLSFGSPDVAELFETSCTHRETAASHRCVRGKTAGAFAGYGTFQWSTAVQAMCLLFVRAKIIDAVNPEFVPGPLLQGRRGSPASSLDMSIGAKTNWLAEMFGIDHTGESFARRIFTRSNSALKLPGPIAMGINTRRLAINDIEIFVDQCAAEAEELMLLQTSLAHRFAGLEWLSIDKLIEGARVAFENESVAA